MGTAPYVLLSSPAMTQHWWIREATYYMFVCTFCLSRSFYCFFLFGGWEKETGDDVYGCALYEDGFVEGVAAQGMTYSTCLTCRDVEHVSVEEWDMFALSVGFLELRSYDKLSVDAMRRWIMHEDVIISE